MCSTCRSKMSRKYIYSVKPLQERNYQLDQRIKHLSRKRKDTKGHCIHSKMVFANVLQFNTVSICDNFSVCVCRYVCMHKAVIESGDL